MTLPLMVLRWREGSLDELVAAHAHELVEPLHRDTSPQRFKPRVVADVLAGTYMLSGLDADLAKQVAVQLMAKDALGAFAGDEFCMSGVLAARRLQAAFASASAVTMRAAAPLAFLVVLGALSAYSGGASITRGIVPVTFLGALAMVLTAGEGRVFDVAA